MKKTDKTGQVLRGNDKRIMKRVYFTEDAYLLLFKAAKLMGTNRNPETSANDAIGEFCVTAAENFTAKFED